MAVTFISRLGTQYFSHRVGDMMEENETYVVPEAFA